MKRPRVADQKLRLLLLTLLMTALFGLMAVLYFKQEASAPSWSAASTTQKAKTPVEPTVTTQTQLEGLSHPWDVVFLPTGTVLFNERDGQVSKIQDGKKVIVADINDVYAVGEGGLTGLALDAKFAENRFVYTCFNAQTSSGLDVRLARWRLSEDEATLTDRKDIVTGIPSNVSGRHSGCRVRSDKAGNLWVGTGDAAVASYPQDPKSLGGKILHVTREGMPAGSNLPAPFDPRIFSYGHRNVQGLVLFDAPRSGVYGYSVEHGSDRDDEVNMLKSGNFGWAPKVTYVEDGIAMTDLQRFPDAVSAVWSSGYPTIAPSGAVLLANERWGTWNGSVAIAVLKAKQIKILGFTSDNSISLEKTILQDQGRVRSVALSPSGDMYVTTDNGTNDKILKLIPGGNEQ